MVITQSKQTENRPNDEKPFAIQLLKGKLGQAVVETYFTHFGYEIYPFGYENHYANVTRFVKRDPMDKTITKLRAMPDLLVFDRVEQESYLVEIKANNLKNKSEYWIEKKCFEGYKSNWLEAFLVVYDFSSGDIRCTKISELYILRKDVLSHNSGEGYFVNWNNFHELQFYFKRMKQHECNELKRQIQEILGNLRNPSLKHSFAFQDDSLLN